MKTAILTVGTEILFGQVVNTNAAYLSKSLQNLGYDVMYHYTVGDNPGRLKELLDFAYHDCDLIITTGGLGPTQDDLTKEIISEYFGEKLVEYPDQLKILTDHFKNSRYKWTENNRKQAWFPENNCTVLANPHGTAPGFMISKNGKNIIAMPGPPREMTEMFETHVKPILESKRDSVIYYKIIRTINLGESSMETILLPLIDGQTDPTIATYAKEGECSLRVTSKRPTYEEAKAACDEMIGKVNDLIGEYIYSYEDEDLLDVVGRILKEKNITISCAESCTAEEVALEMVTGLKKKTGSDLCIAITGVAGPEDMSPDKPAGMAYIGISYKDETRVVKVWRGNRGRFWNRNFFVLRMLNEVYQSIK